MQLHPTKYCHSTVIWLARAYSSFSVLVALGSKALLLCKRLCLTSQAQAPFVVSAKALWRVLHVLHSVPAVPAGTRSQVFRLSAVYCVAEACPRCHTHFLPCPCAVGAAGLRSACSIDALTIIFFHRPLRFWPKWALTITTGRAACDPSLSTFLLYHAKSPA